MCIDTILRSSLAFGELDAEHTAPVISQGALAPLSLDVTTRIIPGNWKISQSPDSEEQARDPAWLKNAVTIMFPERAEMPVSSVSSKI